MPQRTDIFELGRLGLTSGEGRRIELHAAVAGFDYGGQRYEVEPALVPVLLDVSRTTGNGWAMRLRFEAALQGPCMRCGSPASQGARTTRGWSCGWLPAMPTPWCVCV